MTILNCCVFIREVYVLWDGAFSLARKIDPTDEDTETYQRFVLAALKGSLTLQCSITPGGLGDKMEDWVERLHQWGIRLRRRFRTVQDPLVCANVREKASSRCNHPDVLARVDATDAGNKQKISEKKADLLSARQKNSAMRGGSKHWIISSTARRRDLPGWRYYSTMGRLICMDRKATRRNIGVILRRGSECE